MQYIIGTHLYIFLIWKTERFLEKTEIKDIIVRKKATYLNTLKRFYLNKFERKVLITVVLVF